MTQVNAIIANGKIVVVKKDFEDENRDVFLKRSWWIARSICKDPKKETQHVENESYVWSSITHHKVSYEQDVMVRVLS
jgi:hypothetical protein